MKPLTGGEFFKELLLKVADVVCSEKKELFSAISLSARTVTRRIEELAANVRSGLEGILNNLEYYSIGIDETRYEGYLSTYSVCERCNTNI